MQRFAELSILVPAFDEAEAIREVVEGVLAACPGAEVIVCDDGSRDGTAEALDGLPVTVVRHDRNRGYGASWKTLARRASRDWLVFFDGDGQFDAADVGRLLAERDRTGADMVSGARVAGRGRPVGRRPGKWLLRRFADWSAGSRIPDVNCGLRLVRRRTFLPYLSVLPDGFSCSTTSLLAYLATGRHVGFVDISVARRVGTSSVRMLRDGLGSLLLIVRLTALFAPLRVFLPTSLLLTGVGVAYSVWEAVTEGAGVPVLGATLVINGLLVFLFGILSDQVSALRLDGLRLAEDGAAAGPVTG